MAKKWSKEKYTDDSYGGFDVAYELINDMREQDMQDIVASGGDVVFEICASLQGCQENYIYRGENEELLAIMGISTPIPNTKGRSIWMLGTNALNDMSYYKQLLITEAKQVIAQWVKEYGLLFNAVNKNNDKSIRWLTRLGAEWNGETIEIDGNVFLKFTITERGVKNV